MFTKLRRFIGRCSLYQRCTEFVSDPEDGGSKFLRNKEQKSLNYDHDENNRIYFAIM
jgi:hypothetical protein